MVVTLFHFYCGLRQCKCWVSSSVRSASSNPFPFLLWIATLAIGVLLITLKLVVTLFHFYCGLRQNSVLPLVVFILGSNPFPFLLWIATAGVSQMIQPNKKVVTLFHFYCGLRLFIWAYSSARWLWCSNPFPFLLWIATSRSLTCSCPSKP